MNFYNSVTAPVTVQWYFVPEGTPFLPFPTKFSSSVWDSDPKGDMGLGEVLGSARTWVNGKNPATGNGAGFCGTADQWLNGVSDVPDPPVDLDLYSQPLCCGGAVAAPSAIPVFASAWTIVGPGGSPAFHTPPAFPMIFRKSPLHTVVSYKPNAGGTISYAVISPPSVVTVPINWELTFPSPNFAKVTASWAPGIWAFNSVTWQGTFLSLYSPVQLFPPSITDPNPGTCWLWGTEDMLVGAVVWDAGTDAIPAGYLLCNGQSVSRGTYSALFARIGVAYGAGDGATTFNLPDLQDRVCVGSSPGGLGTDRPTAHSMGATGGEEAHTLNAGELPTHNHALTDPGHTHTPLGDQAFWTKPAVGGNTIVTTSGGIRSNQTLTTASATTGISLADTGGGLSHNNMPPFLTVRPLIYAGV